MSRLGSVGARLYRGEVSVDFVGRQKLWYSISGVILVVSVVALATLGLNFSVDFRGGSVFQFPAGKASISQVRSTVSAAGGGQDTLIQHIAPIGGGPAKWQVQTDKLSGFAAVNKIQDAIGHRFGIPQNKISTSFVGATWGGQISQKALQALIAFLVVVVIYLSIAFEWKMAASALIALAHDIVITVGVYALLRFQVAPASVIGLLTILGYSLYDTVVVFDKVRENTAGLLGSARSTYSQAANLALNQTLVRSINTSVVALLPVAGILFIGAGLLGAGELQDLALVLFIGMLSGTYSSIFIATPVLADLKEREPQYRALAKRVQQRAAGGRKAARAARATVGARGQGDPGERGASGQEPDEPGEQPGGDAAGTDETGATVPAGRAGAGGSPSRPPRPGQRQQPRRNQARRRPSGKKKRR
ncbi:MAG: protein translocase subunit SecF [Nocardiopsaceae bacterium]|jgi:preprotein translocase subunit SecF|nr:protein translocase subunit SecF [Nocardiopsaceae bacterium]